MKRAKIVLNKFNVGATICLLSLLYVAVGLITSNNNVTFLAGLILVVGWLIFVAALNEEDTLYYKNKRSKKKAK